MRLVIDVIMLVLALRSKYQCHALGTAMPLIAINDSLERSPRVIKEPPKLSSSVIQLSHQSPEFVQQIIPQITHENVEVIYLESNRLKILPRILEKLSNIKTMSLANNEIADSSNLNVINELPRLQNLVLSRNPLKSIRGLRVATLETLEAGHCEIEEIDGSLSNSLPALRSLDLEANSMETIHEMISGTLTKLILKNCNLSYLPSEAFHGLTNLMYLDLQENELSSMPDTIFLRNKKLRYLNLGKNHLKTVNNAWFKETSNLEVLDLLKNEITSIDETNFAALSVLEKLQLAENKITTLPEFITTAKDLNFSKNSIGNIEVLDLSKMTRLQRLDLGRNQLEGNCTIFRSMSLEILILEYNKLTAITKDCIAHLPSLTDINVKGNRFFDGISPVVFQDNPNLLNVELDDNPWNCNCTQLYPMYSYLESGQRMKTNRLKCDKPENASGRTWWEFCGPNWRELIISEDQVKRGTTWTIAISATAGSFIIFGTLVYIIYTFRKDLQM